MRYVKLIGIFAFSVALLLLTATSAAADTHTQWTYYYGDVNGTYPVQAFISSDRAPSWTVESDDIITGGSCHKSRLVFQSDGNLVLYYAHSDVGSCGGWTVFWASNTNGNLHSWLKFQADGNIVIYRQNGSVAWAAGTNRNTSQVQYWYAAQVRSFGCFYDYYRPPQGGAWTTTFRAGVGC